MTNELTDNQKVAIWAVAKAYLVEALPEITRLIGDKFAQVRGNPEPGSVLDQRGLSDGAKIVSDYIAQNELGIALEHLCYMVEEADLPISMKTYTLLKAAEQTMQVDVPALRRIRPPIN